MVSSNLDVKEGKTNGDKAEKSHHTWKCHRVVYDFRLPKSIRNLRVKIVPLLLKISFVRK